MKKKINIYKKYTDTILNVQSIQPCFFYMFWCIIDYLMNQHWFQAPYRIQLYMYVCMYAENCRKFLLYIHKCGTTITTISYTHSHNTLTTLTTQLQLLSHLASQSSYCPTVFMNSTTQCSTTVVSPQLIDAFVYLDYMYFTTVPCDCRCSLVLV